MNMDFQRVERQPCSRKRTAPSVSLLSVFIRVHPWLTFLLSMKTESEHRLLLDDVLAEAAPADFERALRDGTLCAVRRRRRMHHWSRGLAVVGVFGAMALVVWRTLLPGTPVKVIRPALRMVSSRPLPPSMIVTTTPGSVAVVASSPKKFVLVETGSIMDPFKEIDDEQLLALTGGRPAALVRQGPHQAELLFLNPEDTNGFPVQ